MDVKSPKANCDMITLTKCTAVYPADYRNADVIWHTEHTHGCHPCDLFGTEYCNARCRILKVVAGPFRNSVTIESVLIPPAARS